ncbi:SDR family NAD(P)-dependent oxidoreductase [Phenylobacterium sp.]|uniref:SDR family NAD(P)-dependent oxidoreductase n=1 Tax=Phenylobacterium sp. TaxID=1871053 RepID=UPI0035634E2D
MPYSSHEIAARFRLDGRVALVTGADRGIGQAIADGLEAAGAKVMRHCKAANGDADIDAAWLSSDLAQRDGAEVLARQVRARTSRLDILVNNAGVERPGSIETLNPDDLDETLAVNARAPVQLVAALLPELSASKAASVVNVTSIHEWVPYPGNVAYGMAKAALAMFTRTASIELAPKGIRVNNLAPGAVATDINRELLTEIGHERFASWIPAGRVAEVDDMVGPALFLASDASLYVTGTTLVADGGYGRNVVRY